MTVKRRNHPTARLVIVLGALAIPLLAADSPGKPVRVGPDTRYGKLPLSFEANQGQTDLRVRFLARGPGYTLFLTATEAVLVLRGPSSLPVIPSPEGRDAASGKSSASSPPSVFRLKLLGANRQARIIGLDELTGKSNYFLGNDPTKWRTNVPHFARVRYAEVYDGIDLVFYGTSNRDVEFDFHIWPGADPDQIRLAFEGADQIRTEESGDVLLAAGSVQVRLKKPNAFQQSASGRREVAARYSVRGGREVAFQFDGYSEQEALILDPVLVYSTFLGGDRTDHALSVAADNDGHAYITGRTDSGADFPIAGGAQPTYGGRYDGYIAKLDTVNSQLIFSTFLGGSEPDDGIAIALDPGGNTYVAGITTSPDFPVVGALGNTHHDFGGSEDVFVSKLSSTGDSLLYSLALGSSTHDRAFGIAVDANGSAYVTGSGFAGGLLRLSFPTTPGSFQPAPISPGNSDAFVLKLTPTGDAFAYSTFLGGTYAETGFGIAVDSQGHAYVAGETNSLNFPTRNPFQQDLAGEPSQPDAFVAKLNPAGSDLVFSSYYGGSWFEIGARLAVGADGSVYVAGRTASDDLPLVNPFQVERAGDWGSSDAFVAKINSAGSALVYSTYLGGDQDEGAHGMAVDDGGNAYVVGTTLSEDFPVRQPLVPIQGGGYDSIIVKFDPSGQLLYSTYFGGDDNVASEVALDGRGFVYVVGVTSSPDFPTTFNAFQPFYNFGEDGFLTVLAETSKGNPVPALRSLQPASAVAGAPGLTLTINGFDFITPSQVFWNNEPRTTTFVSTQPLQALLLPGDLAAPGTAFASVVNPGPGGGASNPLRFTICPSGTSVPTLTQIYPFRARIGDSDFVLRARGGCFYPGTTVRWNGSDRATTFVNHNEVLATILAADVSACCTGLVTVFNPGTGGGEGGLIPFQIQYPPPVLSSITPSGVTAGSSDIELTLQGDNFFNDHLVMSTVFWQFQGRSTTFVSSTELRAVIPASDIVQAGVADVRVWGGGGTLGGGISKGIPFTILPLGPTAINSSGAVNSASFGLGPGLAPGSIAAVFGTNLASSTAVAGSLPLPTTLGGAAMHFNGSLAVPKFFDSPQQVNIQIPWELAGQMQATLTDTVGTATSPGEVVPLASFSPGLFATNAQGFGQGAILIANTPNLAAPMGMFPGSRPAVRGTDFLEIYCTGLGVVINQPASGAAAANLLSTTTAMPAVTIGGVDAPVLFSGLAPGFVGLYVVTLQVPAGAPTGTAVPVVLSIGGIQSNPVTLAVE